MKLPTASYCCLAGLFVTSVGLFFLREGAAAVTLGDASAMQAERGAVLEVDNTEIDLHDVGISEELNASFTIHNHGSRRLVLNEWNCECDDRIARTFLFAPGKSETVTLTFPACPSPGRFEDEVCFDTNDPAYPLLRLKVIANAVDR